MAIASETEYTLAERAILPEPWLASSEMPDALARRAVSSLAPEPALHAAARVIIRKMGESVSVRLFGRGTPPPSFVKCVEAVAVLLRLPAGWNAHSAKPITPEAAIGAIRVATALLDPSIQAPIVVPRVGGGIQLEWHTPRVEIEVYVDADGRIAFYAEDIESGDITEVPLSGHEHVLKDWVQRLCGR